MSDPIRKVPPLRPLQPVAPGHRPPPRAAQQAFDAAWAGRQKWHDAGQGMEPGAVSAQAVQALPHRDGGQGDGAEDKDKDSAARALAARPRQAASAGAAGLQASLQAEPVPAEIIHLARMISAFAAHATVQDSWAARVPLSERLMPDAVLHLHCAQRVLALRFETTNWSSRDLIQRHSQALLSFLREALPMLTEIYQAPD